MQMLARVALGLGVFGLLVAAFSFTRPAWMTRMNLDVWELPRLWGCVEEERQRREGLDLAFQTLSERMRRKIDLQAELIAGRVTLARVARHYRQITPSSDEFWGGLRLDYPSLSETERLYRYLVSHVEMALKDAPERTRVLARLQAELAELQRGSARVSSLSADTGRGVMQ